MTRSMTTIAAVLLLCLGVFLLMQYERPGWAQVAPSDSVSETLVAVDPFGAPTPPKKLADTSKTSSDLTPATPGSAAGAATGPATGSAPVAAGEVEPADYGSGMYSDAEYDDYGGRYGSMYGGDYDMGSGPAPLQSRLNQKAAELRQAKSDDERERAKKALEKLLGDYFDNDMRRRQAELDQVKERVAKLEALFKKRQGAKKEIIDLQLKTMVNESEGLGFFSGPASGYPGGYLGGGYGKGYGDEMMGGYGEEYRDEGMMGGYGGGEYGMEEMYEGGGYEDEYGSGYGGGYEGDYDMGYGPAPLQARLNQKAAELRQARSGAQRERAKKALEELLGDYFDNDLRRRQVELDQVKERVAKLEVLFKKRQGAKEEIIELQLKTMVNESEGLGFFSGPASGYPGGYPGGGGYGEGYGDEMMGSYGEEYGEEGMMGEYGEGGYGMEMYGGGVGPRKRSPR